MALLIFHLVLSNFTVEGVDIRIASRILEWNLKRYPDGMPQLSAIFDND